jgi:hypothetical protein
MTRLDWLEEQLENGDLDEETRAKYEREANSIAEAQTAAQRARKQKEQELKLKINNIKSLYEGGSRKELVKLYGDEFIQDYETIQEGEEFVVYSAVARDFQNTRWVCTSAQTAEEKIVELLGHRVYDHYVRDRQ